MENTNDSMEAVATAEARATFHDMQDGTAQDWAIISKEFRAYSAVLPDRVLAHLRDLDDHVFAVDIRAFDPAAAQGGGDQPPR